MFRRRAVLGAALFAIGTSGLAAQTQAVLWAGAGPFWPTRSSSSFSENANSTGFNITGGLGVVTGRGSGSIRIDGQFGSLNFKKLPSGYRPYERIFALSFDLLVEVIPRGFLRPYVLIGPSFAHYTYSNSELGAGDTSYGKLGFNGGLGTLIGSSPRFGGFIEGRIVATSRRVYYPITAGLRIKLRRPTERG